MVTCYDFYFLKLKTILINIFNHLLRLFVKYCFYCLKIKFILILYYLHCLVISSIQLYITVVFFFFTKESVYIAHTCNY